MLYEEEGSEIRSPLYDFALTSRLDSILVIVVVWYRVQLLPVYLVAAKE